MPTPAPRKSITKSSVKRREEEDAWLEAELAKLDSSKKTSSSTTTASASKTTATKPVATSSTNALSSVSPRRSLEKYGSGNVYASSESITSSNEFKTDRSSLTRSTKKPSTITSKPLQTTTSSSSLTSSNTKSSKPEPVTKKSVYDQEPSLRAKPVSSSVSKPVPAKKKEEEAAYDYEDDDFEEYEEDFEDFKEDGEEENVKPASKPQPQPQPERVPVKSPEPVQTQTQSSSTSPTRSPTHQPDFRRTTPAPTLFPNPVMNPATATVSDVRKALEEENSKIANLMKPKMSTTITPTSTTSSSSYSQQQQQQQSQQQSEEDLAEAARKSQVLERNVVDLETSRKQAAQSRHLSKFQLQRMKRFKELSKLVEWDFMSYDLFDMAPLTEYDLYIRSYGSANTCQVAVQSNEDGLEKEMQTEDWDVEDKWVQAGDELVKDCGTGYPDHLSSLKSVKRSDLADKANAMQSEATNVDSINLLRFLKNCAPVLDVLLDESLDQDERLGVNITSKSSLPFFLPFSKGFMEFPPSPILQGRRVRTMMFSPMDKRVLLIALSLPTLQPGSKAPKTYLYDMGIVCLWHLSNPKYPYRILACAGDPASCTFSPKADLIFAGTTDGSVVVWDIRDTVSTPKPISPAHVIDFNGEIIALQLPSYDTAGLYTGHATSSTQCHQEPIINVLCPELEDEGFIPFKQDDMGSSRSGRQVVSIDAGGLLQSWMVVDVKESAATEVQVDYGMAFGSRIKLVRGSSMVIQNPEKHGKVKDIRVTTSAIHPQHPGKLFLGTDLGTVLQDSRYQERCIPRTFESKTNTPVTTISFSKWNLGFFLAGYRNGSIQLYNFASPQPLKTWKASSSPIIQVSWASQRPAVFYVLDAESVLTVWDLSETANGPALVNKLKDYRNLSMSANLGKLSQFVVPKRQVKIGGNEDGGTNASSSTSSVAMGLAFESGVIEIHVLDTQWTEMAIDEENVLPGLLKAAVM